MAEQNRPGAHDPEAGRDTEYVRGAEPGTDPAAAGAAVAEGPAGEGPAGVVPAVAGEAFDDFELPGVPDAFQRLWTPHRMAYIRGGQNQYDDAECPFCAAPGRSNEQSLIVHRGRFTYVVLNLFPYNPGHLLICPYRHVPDYTDITVAETTEMAEFAQTSMRVLRTVANATGFNLGMNQGTTGGAGIAAHLHQHVVPRWGGDGNFLPIIAQTKAVTQTLGDVREQLAAAWPSACGTASESGAASGSGAASASEPDAERNPRPASAPKSR